MLLFCGRRLFPLLFFSSLLLPFADGWMPLRGGRGGIRRFFFEEKTQMQCVHENIAGKLTYVGKPLLLLANLVPGRPLFLPSAAMMAGLHERGEKKKKGLKEWAEGRGIITIIFRRRPEWKGKPQRHKFKFRAARITMEKLFHAVARERSECFRIVFCLVPPPPL